MRGEYQKKWLNFGYILKVLLVEIIDRFNGDMKERKK